MATSSFSVAGGAASDKDKRPQKDWVSLKNPHYRTHDIYNKWLRKDKRPLQLREGDLGMTDCNTFIQIKFSADRWIKVATELDPLWDGTTRYRLECGHEWEGKNPQAIGKELRCAQCSAHEGYLQLMHEWQHNWAKTDVVAKKLFVDGLVVEYDKLVPNLDKEPLAGFLHFLVNVFDDIRCNSLEEYIFPGTAEGIWERWKRITEETGNYNDDFIGFLFATALGIETDPTSPFKPLEPVLEWALSRVRYKGFGNMLGIVRIALDRSVGAYLEHFIKQPQPPQQAGGQSQSQQQGGANGPSPQGGSQTNDPASQGAGSPPPQQGGSSIPDAGSQGGDPSNGQRREDASGAGSPPQPGGSGEPQGADPQNPEGNSQGNEGQPSAANSPSAQQLVEQGQATKEELAAALSKLIEKAQSHSGDEAHKQATPEDVSANPNSKTTQAMVARALGLPTNDLNAVDQMVQPGTIDPDMFQAVQQVQAAAQSMSPTSQLLADARAKIQLIDVLPENINKGSIVVLSSSERQAVERMRGAFFRSLGRQRARRAEDGLDIDIEALVQQKIEAKLGILEPGDPFKHEGLNQGFAYGILTDMSGSMRHLLEQIMHATEMLDRALDFPFVDGRSWGFRGGESVPTRSPDAGEVWLYKYDPKCKGLLGKAHIGRHEVPVDCGGLTPMAAALRICVKYMITQVPAGMARRLFLLTDGSPYAMRTSGNKNAASKAGYARSIPERILRQFVRQEIAKARQKGVQVYTLVIGDGVSDEEAKSMFDPERFWRRCDSKAGGPESVDRMLQKLVLENFTRYLRARG